MDRENDINLLLVHDNVDEANRLVSLLRNANYRVHPQYAENATDLSRMIQERNWELALVDFACEGIPAKTVFHQVRRVNKDIPIVLIIDSYDANQIVDGLRMGAADVVPMDADQHLIQVVERTLHDLEQRRRLRYWKRRFTESENRFEALVMSSQDGIAIIQEGTFVLANDSYATFFGHASHDDMVLMPVIDSIARQDQFEFKKYLKPLQADNALDSETIYFTGINAHGEEISVRALLSQVDYHGEPALQLLIKKDYLSHPVAQAQGDMGMAEVLLEEEDIGKIRLNEMVETINGAIRRSAKSGEDVLLYYLQIDHYDRLQKKLGIRVTEEGIRQLAHYLRDQIDETLSFGRIREDAFILVGPNMESEASLAYARGILNQAKAQMFDTGSGVFSCTLSVGISAINEASTSADDCLDHCIKAIADLRSEGNAAKFYEPVFEVSAPDMSAAELVTIGRQLISHDLIHLLYQPIISLHGQGDPFYEVRMAIKEGAFSDTRPEDFLHRLFATEIGRDLDRHVISLALKSMSAQLREAPNSIVALSLNEASITDPQFLPWLTGQIKETRVPSTALLFQLREIDIGRNLTKAAALLSGLHQLGAQTALTHFGLAINPMAMLRKLAPDYIKIDGVLVEKTQKGTEALQNLIALIEGVKAENLKVIVPHVETATILPTLWQAGVHFIQGHYVSQPLPEMNFRFDE